jgi:hypothetical protein
MVGEAPSIAGYVGAYTGVKSDVVSVSFNVRELYEEDGIEQNLQNEIDPLYTSPYALIQNVILNAKSYSEAADMLKNTKIVSPCYIIVAGVNPNEGMVIVRDRDGTNRTEELSSDSWFVAATNRDFWLE